jgi:hypothetical protein
MTIRIEQGISLFTGKSIAAGIPTLVSLLQQFKDT